MNNLNKFMIYLAVIVIFIITIVQGKWWVLPAIFFTFIMFGFIASFLHSYSNKKNINIYIVDKNQKYIPDEVFQRDKEDRTIN